MKMYFIYWFLAFVLSFLFNHFVMSIWFDQSVLVEFWISVWSASVSTIYLWITK